MMDRAGFGTSFTSDIENTESLLAKVATDSPAVSEVDRQRGRTHASFTEGAPGQIKVSSAYVTRDEALAMLQELDPGHRFSKRTAFQTSQKLNGRFCLSVCVVWVATRQCVCSMNPSLFFFWCHRNHPPQVGIEAASQAWTRPPYTRDPRPPQPTATHC